MPKTKKSVIENLRVVMVGITHPGNIGAAARAMKTMGYSTLYLVKPKIYPHADATARAAGADNILDQAIVCDTFEQALHGCITVIASTARNRTITCPVYTPREYSVQLPDVIKRGPTALVFGREHSGLTNQELEYCNAIIHIPTNAKFSSLNVASAVQIICYEFSQALQLQHENSQEKNIKEKVRLATSDEMVCLYNHLQESLENVGFLNPKQPRQLMRRLKSLFNRAQLDENEMSILRGFFSAIQNAILKKHEP